MLLELKNIKKYYPVKKGFFQKTKSFVKAVDDVTIHINDRENLALVGESGCGKTTLARIIVKLIPMDSGNMLFCNNDITSLSNKDFESTRKDIQMVFQDPYNSLDPRYTIRMSINEAMLLEEKVARLGDDQREDKMRAMMENVKLDPDMLDRYPHEFSGGERQRIAIARAAILNPKLLVLDEAVSSLDVIIQQQIIELLADLQKQYSLTYLFISHNLRVVKKISQKIGVMYKGRIVEYADKDNLFGNPLHPYTKELLSAALNYKSISQETDYHVDPNAQLVEKQKGHFVIES